jgi:hypothetical protein
MYEFVIDMMIGSYLLHLHMEMCAIQGPQALSERKFYRIQLSNHQKKRADQILAKMRIVAKNTSKSDIIPNFSDADRKEHPEIRLLEHSQYKWWLQPRRTREKKWPDFARWSVIQWDATHAISKQLRSSTTVCELFRKTETAISKFCSSVVFTHHPPLFQKGRWYCWDQTGLQAADEQTPSVSLGQAVEISKVHTKREELRASIQKMINQIEWNPICAQDIDDKDSDRLIDPMISKAVDNLVQV